MTTRNAIREDLQAIDSVFRRSFCDTFAHLYDPADLALFLGQFTPAAWSQEFSDPRYAFRVAEVDGQVVGYAKLGPSALPVQAAQPAVELRQIYILRQFQGRGLAAELMGWAIAEARDRGATELYLTVFTGNERARRVYGRYGFEPAGRYNFMVGNHADEDIIMRKTL